MTQKEGRTVLGSVLDPTHVVESTVDELSPVAQSELRNGDQDCAGHGRMLLWLDRDARRCGVRPRRRIFEIVALDGRSLMSVDLE